MNETLPFPYALQPGDKIVITSPAGRVEPEKVRAASSFLESRGFRVSIMPHTLGSHFQFSGTVAQRLADLQQALDDKECKAILMSRGGYGLVRILDHLNFETFRKHPKWIIGFSDITLLHARIGKMGGISIHGPMTAAFLQPESRPVQFLMQLLNGERPFIHCPSHALNRFGKGDGILTGGNLAILASLCGTPDQPDTSGKILLLEDVGEYLYRIDRMMYTLKRSGLLDSVAGLVVGSFSEIKDSPENFGMTAEEIIYEAIEDFRGPVCFGFPSGHISCNLPVLLGAKVHLSVTEDDSGIEYI